MKSITEAVAKNKYCPFGMSVDYHIQTCKTTICMAWVDTGWSKPVEDLDHIPKPPEKTGYCARLGLDDK